MSELVIPPTTPLTEDEARALTDEVKATAESLWLSLRRLYDGAAHLALGYQNWGSYFTSEFGGSQSHAYRMLEAGRVATVLDSPMGERIVERQARELVPLLKDEAELVEAWREVKDTYGDKATAIDVKRVVTNRLERIQREEDATVRRIELASQPIPTPTDESMWVEHADISDWIRTNDIDGATVISDPPYPREYLPAWEILANHGYEAGVSQMVLMCGQTIMADVISIFVGEGWNLRWCCAYLTEGPATRVWHSAVGTKWKPLLVFDLNDERPFLTQDVFTSTGDDKRHHHWGQNEQGFAHIVEAFTNPGDLVVDPFLGGGTTAIVCRDLGRRFAGCDVDQAAVNATLARLAA